MFRKVVISSLLIILLLVIQAGMSPWVNAQEFDLDALSAILIEAETGNILYEKNADEKLPPASITKIMAMLLTMEEIESGDLSLDDEVTISESAASMGGSQIYLGKGVKVTVEDLLKAVTIASANDASVALGEVVAGNYERFINMMNERAEELGMENTYFSNSTGLPTESKHHSTARDIAIMSRELVKYQQILDWASIWVDYVELPDRRAMLSNTNKLIRDYPGLDGLKTGHTEEAGFCLAATASRNNLRLVSVVLKTESEEARQKLTSQLLDYGFNRFVKQEYIAEEEKIQNIKIPEGKQRYLTGEIENALKIVVKRGRESEVEGEIVLDEKLSAPVEEGEVVGEYRAVLDDNVINSVDILASEDIERANIFVRLWRKFVNWIGGILENI
ncbi:MAG: D-alanyl-D-alanine carboxypeptidase family protein [Halanaerobiales bacterium]